MMKSKLTTLIAISLMALAGWAVAGQKPELVIEANSTYTVTKTQSEQLLSRLWLGDNAVVLFEPDVDHWHLEVESAHIGKNVVINGNGVGGEHGQAGVELLEKPENCQDGKSGQDAADGSRGGDAVSISMYLVVDSIQSLTILSNGGPGGDGGHGGMGQQAGKIERCTGPDGGRGGHGGNGGDGGNGGRVQIVYRYLPGVELSPLARYVNVENAGGAAGLGATGGRGGKGAEGKYVTKRTITGNKQWLAAGKTGIPGLSGEVGSAGSVGQILLEREHEMGKAKMTGPRSKAVNLAVDRIQATGVLVLERKVEALQKTVRTLMQRIDRLERGAQR